MAALTLQPAELVTAAQSYARSALSENTLRAYRSDWAGFETGPAPTA